MSDSEPFSYRGYAVEARRGDFQLTAPNGLRLSFGSFVSLRAWVRWHRRQLRQA